MCQIKAFLLIKKTQNKQKKIIIIKPQKMLGETIKIKTS